VRSTDGRGSWWRPPIQPNELMRLASHTIKCPRCSQVFDEMDGRKPLSTS
jgi:hypothetical protein